MAGEKKKAGRMAGESSHRSRRQNSRSQSPVLTNTINSVFEELERYSVMETKSKAGSSKEFSSQIQAKDEERPSSPAETADCAICLDRLTDKAFTNGCLHMFCFHCLLAWSKIKPECPLCKQEFHSIIHNIRSMTDYDEYDVPPPQARLAVYVSPHINPGPTISGSPQDFFAHNPNSFVSYRTTITSGTYRVPRRRPDNLLIQPYVDNLEIQADFSRMQSDPTEYSRFNRREIYLRELETLPPPTPGRYRQCSPGFYSENEVQVNRLIRWLHRECTVLAQITSRFNASDLLRAVVDMLTVYHINSTTFFNTVNQYLGQHTARFIREFHRYATSPLDQNQYDMECLYIRQRGSQVSFIVTIDRDDSEEVQIIPNGTNHSFRPWIDVNDLGRAQSSTSTSNLTPQSGVNRCPSIGFLSHRQNSHSAQTGQPSTSSMSQTVINISDSENDDCVIIEQVRCAQDEDTIVLDDDDSDAEENEPQVPPSGLALLEEQFDLAREAEMRRAASVAAASSNSGPSRGSSIISTDPPSSSETTGELRTKLKRKRSKKYYQTKQRSNNDGTNNSSDELIVLSDTTEDETDDNDSDWEESYRRRGKSKKTSVSKRLPRKKKSRSAARSSKSSTSQKNETQTTSNKCHQNTTNAEAQTSNIQVDLPRLRSVARKAKNQSVTYRDNFVKTETCACGNIDRSEDEPGPSHGIRHREFCQFYSVTPISKYIYSSDSD